ncbi:AN1-type zinc finger domain-containing protein [Candidatus Bathyarchaeota archaeon]|nr:AN1-type zinc finger domain-containing protein [Candidatus Bathyarchaeota archaeon]
MATPPTSASQETSYREMNDRDDDVSLVGKHCQLEYCNHLDFLPFICQSCKKTFCQEHRIEDSHKCANPGAWARRRREAEMAKPSIGAGKELRYRVSAKPCDSPSCSTSIGSARNPGVHCQTCRRDYCHTHRLKEEHDCKKLVPVGARTGTEMADRTKGAFAKLKAWGSAKRQEVGRALPKPKPTSAAQRVVAVNTLKKTAKGDDKLAADKRVYVNVEAEAETAKAKYPKGAFFYSRDWVVGRVLDAAARSLQVENLNNQSSSENDKLRVFHVEGGRILEFSEKVGSALVSGNTIVLLRGVGPAAPDLIEL